MPRTIDTGGLMGDPFYETVHIKAVSGEDLNFVVDGETYVATELEIKVVPKSLNVLAPAL